MTSRWFQCRRAPAPARGSSIIAIVGLATGLAACTPTVPVAPEPSVRVIARFGPAVLDPLDPAFLVRLAELTRVTRIDPIRPMSGNAYVLQVACLDPRASRAPIDPCPAALARLGRADNVIDIEVDHREKHP